ncbi:MAG: hypothetical protein ACK5HT_02030 [Draconibacterium sp.]
MNTRQTIIIGLVLFCFQSVLIAQEIKLPLEVKSGHLFSHWKLNDSIQTKVMLETGFPKVVISESYALKHLKEFVKLEVAPENTAIGLWGKTNETKVSYLIKDTIRFNGQNIFIDALVADVKSWKDRDIVFPLKDLPGITEININNKYILINKSPERLDKNYEAFDVEFDKNVKGLFLKSTLTVYDSLKTEEKLTGNFLLDLGAPNAIFVNRDLAAVEEFVTLSDRMLLKDTTKFKPNPHIKLAIIMPDEFQIENTFCKGEFIVAMKMLGRNSQKYSGIIGNRFFSHFTVAFDFINNKLYMKPISDKVEIKQIPSP